MLSKQHTILPCFMEPIMYYLMEKNDIDIPLCQLSSPNPKGKGRVRWVDGKQLKRPPKIPLKFELNIKKGPLLPDFFDADMPIFSPRLLKAFTRAGVENIFSYPVELKNPSTGEKTENYQAVNIVGVLRVARLDDLEDVDGSEIRYVSDVDTLKIDPNRCSGQLCFRLYENLSSIIVHKNVVAQIQSDNCIGLKFRAVS